jgi:tripartite-type tricarboxylate transporter receptor subunit TctC
MPVAGVGAIPNLLSVSASGPLRSLADLVQAARAAPGQLSFGSSGPGTGSHLAGELFRVVAGIDITHVPYKGTGTVYPDLIAGRISMVFDVMGGSAISQVQGGRVRALALSSLKRSPALPAVPTFDEQGFPGFQFVTWFGFFVPAGTPAPVIARLAEATRASLATPGVIERMKQIAAEPIPVETAGFARYFEADVERWAALVREGKIARIQN